MGVAFTKVKKVDGQKTNLTILCALKFDFCTFQPILNYSQCGKTRNSILLKILRDINSFITLLSRNFCQKLWMIADKHVESEVSFN